MSLGGRGRSESVGTAGGGVRVVEMPGRQGDWRAARVAQDLENQLNLGENDALHDTTPSVVCRMLEEGKALLRPAAQDYLVTITSRTLT